MVTRHLVRVPIISLPLLLLAVVVLLVLMQTLGGTLLATLLSMQPLPPLLFWA